MNCMVCRGPREQQIYCAECSRMVRLWKREEIPSAVRQLKELRKDNVALRRRIEDLSKKRYHLQQRLIQRQQLQYRLQKSREVLHRAQQGCRQERERLAEWRESNERRAAGLKAARKELKGLQRQLQAQQESAGLKEMRAEREEVEGLIVERRKELIHQLLRLLPIVPMSDSETCIINVLLPNNSSLFLSMCLLCLWPPSFSLPFRFLRSPGLLPLSSCPSPSSFSSAQLMSFVFVFSQLFHNPFWRPLWVT
ncbi:hypothetical protein QOT17_002045 [Balamuthia mandrillaris]